MGKEFYCDYCRVNVAIETALQPVKIGTTELGEACHTCASKLGQNLRENMAATKKQFIAATQAPAALAPAPAQPVPPAQAPAPPPPMPPAAPGGK